MPGRPPPMDKASVGDHLQSGQPSTAPVAHQTTPHTIRGAFQNNPHPLSHGTLPDNSGRGGLHPRLHVHKILAPPQHLPASGTTRPGRGARAQYLHGLKGILRICDQIVDTNPQWRRGTRGCRHGLLNARRSKIKTLASRASIPYPQRPR